MIHYLSCGLLSGRGPHQLFDTGREPFHLTDMISLDGMKLPPPCPELYGDAGEDRREATPTWPE